MKRKANLIFTVTLAAMLTAALSAQSASAVETGKLTLLGLPSDLQLSLPSTEIPPMGFVSMMPTKPVPFDALTYEIPKERAAIPPMVRLTKKSDRVWTVTVTNPDIIPANDARLDGIRVQLSNGSSEVPALLPEITGSDPNLAPVPLGNILQGHSATADITFVAAPAPRAVWLVGISVSANGGKTRALITLPLP